MAIGFAPNTAHMHTQHEPCSFYFGPMHHVNDCPTTRNFANVSNEHVNAAFSCLGNDTYSNTYNSRWRNQPNFSWKAKALGNSALGLHN